MFWGGGRWEGGFSAVCKKQATAQLFPRETPSYLIVPARGLTLLVNPDQPASNTAASASLLPLFLLEKLSKVSLQSCVHCTVYSELVGMPPKRLRLVDNSVLEWRQLGPGWVMGWPPSPICVKPKKLAAALLLRVSWSVTQDRPAPLGGHIAA